MTQIPIAVQSTPIRRSRTPKPELERRWQAVRGAMAQAGLDALVCQNDSDWIGGMVRWFTDMPATNGYARTLVFYANAPMAAIEMGSFDMVREIEPDNDLHFGVGRLYGTPAFQSIGFTNRYEADLLQTELRRSGARRVGVIAPGALPSAIVDALRDLDIVLSDATDLVDTIKAVKSPAEIAMMHEVAALQDAVFAAVCGFFRPGMCDIDVANFAQAEAHRLGSDQGILHGASAPLGQSSRFAPRHLQGRTLAKGEHLSLLIEINGPGGMYLELARTMVLGRAPQELTDAFALMQKAQDHTLSLLKPGAKPADIAAAHDRWMAGHGLPPETRLYAHGQGIDMVERPLIRHDETMPIAQNMVLAVHPGFDDGRKFSVICDNYAIGPDGPGACMHKTEKKIFELD